MIDNTCPDLFSRFFPAGIVAANPAPSYWQPGSSGRRCASSAIFAERSATLSAVAKNSSEKLPSVLLNSLIKLQNVPNGAEALLGPAILLGPGSMDLLTRSGQRRAGIFRHLCEPLQTHEKL